MAYTISVLATLPLIVAVVLYQLDTFAPAQYPDHELTPRQPLFVPKRNSHMLHGLEKIGAAESKVERWVNTGGRPLGLVHGHHGEVIIADAVKVKELVVKGEKTAREANVQMVIDCYEKKFGRRETKNHVTSV
ncbi:unnamed protein product [Fraxinus pennsylvanica]|uniref:Uncharacterized protein n=1 Tax=Fraxinus pennsylvanica TaxID=56036 RepID=A0AAD1YXR3_9LAMI|nr:unnamed protein product [Fraxinus pennsylvanica]